VVPCTRAWCPPPHPHHVGVRGCPGVGLLDAGDLLFFRDGAVQEGTGVAAWHHHGAHVLVAAPEIEELLPAWGTSCHVRQHHGTRHVAAAAAAAAEVAAAAQKQPKLSDLVNPVAVNGFVLLTNWLDVRHTVGS
jgi:hypothetical protein